MRILAIDTALSACSVALRESDRVRAHRFARLERGHAEALLPMVEACLAAAGLSYHDLDGLAVSSGPGTYTGLRIGHAAVRGLAIAARKPVIGVSCLEAVAHAAQKSAPAATHTAVVLGTKRADVYLQVFQGKAPAGDPCAVSPTAVAAMLPVGPLLLAGDAAAAIASLIGRGDIQVAPGLGLPDAIDIAELAAKRAERDGFPPVLDFPSPLYLRAPDVTLSTGNAGLRPSP